MTEREPDWHRATSIAFDAFEIALRSGANAGKAVDVALARARAIIPAASEPEVREALSIELAKRQVAIQLSESAEGRRD